MLIIAFFGFIVVVEHHGLLLAARVLLRGEDVGVSVLSEVQVFLGVVGVLAHEVLSVVNV